MIDLPVLYRMLRWRLIAHVQSVAPDADPEHVTDAVETVLADGATGRPVLDLLRRVNFLELVRLVLELIAMFKGPAPAVAETPAPSPAMV